MEKASHVCQGTAANFDSLVLVNSCTRPVLVNYYSPYAAPCLVQNRHLGVLAQELDGQFLLVNINADEARDLVAVLGLRSIPWAQIYKDGEKVLSVPGAASIIEIRRQLRSYVSRSTDKDRVLARDLHESGRKELAYQVLAEAAMKDPDYVQIPMDLAKLMLLDGKSAQACQLLTSLPAQMRGKPEVESLGMHVEFINAASNVENNEKQPVSGSERLFCSAARAVVNDDLEAALEELLHLIQLDPGYRDGIAMRGLKVLFSILGEEHELVLKSRARLTR